MSAVAQVAATLIRGWREGRQQPLPTLELASEAEAYAVQHQVADALGWFASGPPAVWKLGGAPGGLISAAGVPAMAVHPSGWQVPPGDAFGFGIEGELIVRLSRDLDQHTDLAMACAAVDVWMPGIELCGTRWLQGDQAAPLLRLADQQLNPAARPDPAHRPDRDAAVRQRAGRLDRRRGDPLDRPAAHRRRSSDREPPGCQGVIVDYPCNVEQCFNDSLNITCLSND